MTTLATDTAGVSSTSTRARGTSDGGVIDAALAAVGIRAAETLIVAGVYDPGVCTLPAAKEALTPSIMRRSAQ